MPVSGCAPRRYRLLPDGYRVCVLFLKLFERVYAPLTAGLLRPVTGSILRARTEPAHPIAYGLRETIDIFYNNNPLFRLRRTNGVRPVAWIGDEDAPRSGWAWGLDHAKGGVAVADVETGEGRVILIGPLVVFRAHPHGAFKLMFNSLHYGAAESVHLGRSTPAGSRP